MDWEKLVAVISALAAVLSAFYACKANKKADTANKAKKVWLNLKDISQFQTQD